MIGLYIMVIRGINSPSNFAYPQETLSGRKIHLPFATNIAWCPVVVLMPLNDATVYLKRLSDIHRSISDFQIELTLILRK